MPRRTTAKRLFTKVTACLQEANLQDAVAEVIYLNAADLALITPDESTVLLGVTLAASRVVPPEHYCLKTAMDEVRHISREGCRPLL